MSRNAQQLKVLTFTTLYPSAVRPRHGIFVETRLQHFRRFADAEFTGDVPSTIVHCERYIAGSFKRGNEQWPVMGLRSLLEDPLFTGASV